MENNVNHIIPNGWIKTELREILKTSSPPAKLKTKEYLKDGNYPIIDQGKKIVVGYTNEKSSVMHNLPALIFGDHTKEVKLINFPFAAGGDGVKILYSKQINKGYLKFLIECAVKKLPNLGYSRHFSELKNIIEIFPQKKAEQKAIAHVLSLFDTAINKNNQFIAQKELSIKWLMQNLLTGKKRLKGFSGDWKDKKLKDVLNQAGIPLIPEEDKLYQQIGIRSHTKGIFHKEKVTGAALGNKRVFWIEPDCFVVNIVFAWEHAIAKTTDNEIGMIASHRFPMYRPNKDILDLDYLLYFFMTKRGKHLLGLASPGGAGRNKTLGKLEFMKLQIPVPSIEEQKAIAQILSTADKEIHLLKAKTEKLREQKKGMMQVLLTGKKRLNINN
jgi:restriction endonuclease S subunit